MAMVTAGGRIGFVNEKREEIVPLRYDAAFSFRKGKAFVSLNKKWGLIDKKGHTIVAHVFESIARHEKGAIVTKNNKKGRLSYGGEQTIPCVYKSLGHESEEGFLAAKREDGKCGYVNREGKVIIPFTYDEAWDWDFGTAIVKKDGWYGIIRAEEDGKKPIMYPSLGECIRKGEEKAKRQGSEGAKG